MTAPVILSGIQPSGIIHIGNYFGALRPWFVTQAQYQNFFSIVDLHAVTTWQDPVLLRGQTRQLAAIYLAAGLDPGRSVIFVQSHVRAHVELSWLLTCVTPMGWLGRMTQFKEKSGDTEAESVGAGLLNYPLLMAADILAYQADYVPVGDDQRQHLELTRDIAGRFNHIYGDTLNLPQPLIGHAGAGARIMGLDDPTKKMSKSEPNPNHALGLMDSPDLIKRKVMRAQTDSGGEIVVAEAQHGIANLVEIFRAATDTSMEEAAHRLDGMRYGEFKAILADLLVTVLEPIQSECHRLISDPTYLESVLVDGAERAAAVADKTVEQVRDRMGVG